ncbi:MAG: hypothetical protein ACUVRM_05160 [Bacillota bacterium]
MPHFIAWVVVVNILDRMLNLNAGLVNGLIVALGGKLIPWVSANKTITLELNPRITTIIPSESLGLEVTALPGVTERSTQTTIRIMDGYTVVISGFIQESEEITQAKVPILGSLPILGRLFQSTKKTKRQDEFVIIITPRLIEDPTEISDLVAKTSGPGSTSTPIVIDWS